MKRSPDRVSRLARAKDVPSGMQVTMVRKGHTNLLPADDLVLSGATRSWWSPRHRQISSRLARASAASSPAVSPRTVRLSITSGCSEQYIALNSPVSTEVFGIPIRPSARPMRTSGCEAKR
jgi:hypothetical protein